MGYQLPLHLAMPDSLSNKRAVVVIHAIAFTTALAIISGYLPLHLLPFSQLQALFQSNPHTSRLAPKRY
ncbi:MAG: hypothetical protein HC866_15270 [Leptolyngbyaceae cyanobacterium RU_5_1]|nr:hypothetical protein [Leptolyngbyaceae cyanobacterium RU_5_1]